MTRHASDHFNWSGKNRPRLSGGRCDRKKTPWNVQTADVMALEKPKILKTPKKSKIIGTSPWLCEVSAPQVSPSGNCRCVRPSPNPEWHSALDSAHHHQLVSRQVARPLSRAGIPLSFGVRKRRPWAGIIPFRNASGGFLSQRGCVVHTHETPTELCPYDFQRCGVSVRELNTNNRASTRDTQAGIQGGQVTVLVNIKLAIFLTFLFVLRKSVSKLNKNLKN